MNNIPHDADFGFYPADMTNQIHGHDVLEMMMASNQLYSKDSLKAAIAEKFGADTRFHTCSAENMDAGELIEFLAQRGKFTTDAGSFTVDPATICQH